MRNFIVGTANVDVVSGQNYFLPSDDGIHSYVIKLKDNAYYEKQINSIIK